MRCGHGRFTNGGRAGWAGYLLTIVWIGLAGAGVSGAGAADAALEGWAHLVDIQRLADSGRFAEVAALRRAWVDRDPLFAEWLLLGVVRDELAAGDVAAARVGVAELRRRYPRAPEREAAERALAVGLTEAGRLDEAAALYVDLFQRHPARQLETSLQLARLRLAQGDTPRAAIGLTRVWQRSKSGRLRLEAATLAADHPAVLATVAPTAESLTDLLRVLVQARELDRSGVVLGDLRQRFPAAARTSTVVFLEARRHFFAGRTDDAVSHFQLAARAGPEDLALSAVLGAGRALTAVGRDREALARLRAGLAARPALGRWAPLWVALYDTARRAGEEQPERLLAQGLATVPAPAGGPLRYRQAKHWLRSGDVQGAEMLLRVLLPGLGRRPEGVLPDRWEALYLIGRCRELQGDWVGALDAWSEAALGRETPFAFRARSEIRRLTGIHPVEAGQARARQWRQMVELAAAGRQEAAFVALARVDALGGDHRRWRAGLRRLPTVAASWRAVHRAAPLGVDVGMPAAGSSPVGAARPLARVAIWRALGFAGAALDDLQSLRERDVAARLGVSNRVAGHVLALTAAELAGCAGRPSSALRWGYRLLDAYPRLAPLGRIRPDVRRAAWPEGYGDLIRSLCRGTDLSPHLVLAVIHQESRFDPRALSPAGARGLMQLMPGTAARLALPEEPGHDPRALFGPELNLVLGTRYLRALLAEFGHPAAAAAAYNAGEVQARVWQRQAAGTGIWDYLPEITFPETRHYAGVVLANAHVYEDLYPDLAASRTAGWPVDGKGPAE